MYPQTEQRRCRAFETNWIQKSVFHEVSRFLLFAEWTSFHPPQWYCALSRTHWMLQSRPLQGHWVRNQPHTSRDIYRYTHYIHDIRHHQDLFWYDCSSPEPQEPQVKCRTPFPKCTVILRAWGNTKVEGRKHVRFGWQIHNRNVRLSDNLAGKRCHPKMVLNEHAQSWIGFSQSKACRVSRRSVMTSLPSISAAVESIIMKHQVVNLQVFCWHQWWIAMRQLAKGPQVAVSTESWWRAGVAQTSFSCVALALALKILDMLERYKTWQTLSTQFFSHHWQSL